MARSGHTLARFVSAVLCTMLIATAYAKQSADPVPKKARSARADTRDDAIGQRLQLRLQRLADGDSFSAYDADGSRYEVRLAAIDAPERDQAGAQAATDSLRNLIGRNGFELEVRKRDRYGRLIGRVLVNGRDAGLHQVRSGFAWHFRRYENEQPASQRTQFREAEQAARRENLGLWKDANPTPPWQWRRDKRRNRRAPKRQ